MEGCTRSKSDYSKEREQNMRKADSLSLEDLQEEDDDSDKEIIGYNMLHRQINKDNEEEHSRNMSRTMNTKARSQLQDALEDAKRVGRQMSEQDRSKSGTHS